MNPAAPTPGHPFAPGVLPCPPLPSPALRLAFDAAALAHNWRALDRLSGAAAAGAAVKADCYGIGADRAVPVLAKAGCRDFFVAHWAEVATIARHVPAEAVAVLHGPVAAADAAYARATGARPVLNSMAQVARWIEAGGGPCDLMFDTGMNRLGLRPDEAGNPLIAQLQIVTLMSHLACADEDSPANERQRRDFAALAARLPHRRASLANSAGIALGAGYRFDLTRPGLALYGGVPRSELAEAVRPVVAPEAAIVQVRDIAAGETVGYNGTFTAHRPKRIGIVGLGYADGYLRCWSGGIGSFCAAASGDRLPVVGRVSMDMTAIDLTAAPDLHEGDWVRAQYSLPAAAQASGLSQYELLTLCGARLAR